MDGHEEMALRGRNRNVLTLFRQYVTVEPVLAVFMFCLFLMSPVEEQLIYRKTCLQFYNDSICEKAIHSKDKMYAHYEDVVQKETSKLLIYKNLILTFPSVLSTLLLSSISDKVGRRFLMLSPFFGSALQAIGLILNSYYMHGAVPYVFIGSAVAGCFGNFACVLTSVFAYIADISSESSRTLRVGVLEAMVFVGGALGEIVGGILLDNLKSGFFATFSIVLTGYVITIIYIVVYVKESHSPPKTESFCQTLCSKEHLLHVVKATTRPRENSRRTFLLLILLVFGAQVIVFVGGSVISVLYVLHQPLKWSSSLLGYFLASGMVMKGCGVLIGMPILLRKLKIADYTFIVMGLSSTMAMYIVFGFAKETWVMFFGTVIGIGSGLSAPCLRSMLTKLVHKSERGSVMAAVACVDVLASLLSHLIFDSVYYGTVQWYPGFSFFVMAALLLMPFGIIWFLQSRHKEGFTYVHINEDVIVNEESPEELTSATQTSTANE